MEKEDYHLTSRVIAYLNEKLKNRRIGLSNQFYAPLWCVAEAQFWTHNDDITFNIKFDVETLDEGTYANLDEWDGGVVPPINVIDSLYRNWHMGTMSIECF